MAQRDCIRVIGLTFEAAHGVFPEEAATKQPFEVDIEIVADLSEAAQSDELEQTIDYRRLADEAAAVMNGPRRLLLEKLAGDIIERVGALAGECELTVRIRKPKARLNTPFETVEVELTRVFERR